MKTPLVILLCAMLSISVQAQHILISKTASISFYASTPAEDVEAKSDKASSVIDTKTRNIIFKVSNTSFQFPKKLMQEHFNENYMESDKYPASTFKGKITDDVDLEKDGTYNVTIDGSLDIHGVTKNYQTKATLVVNKGTITAKTSFKVTVADHQIKIPTLVFAKIAQIVDVKISAVYQPK
ncbi:YceI-like domain-containing protein [Pedobacter westerhofensis]|uniref:YceI-like domain-containing protein n=1 Tax=Pedobacter westerhofensis TaxID=425512 RepID=A0A521F6A3_9SPHI|nr:YceI family protein [Pedobacter westerhofensis]SMO91709.1 YceI-like domain-containing protein [Pedobacter westerhofensis]